MAQKINKSEAKGIKDKLLFMISVILIIILIANLILLALGKIKDVLFWFIIILAGLSSYMMKKIRTK